MLQMKPRLDLARFDHVKKTYINNLTRTCCLRGIKDTCWHCREQAVPDSTFHIPFPKLSYGTFCSFNCMMSYLFFHKNIFEDKDNKIYQYIVIAYGTTDFVLIPPFELIDTEEDKLLFRKLRFVKKTEQINLFLYHTTHLPRVLIKESK